MGNNAATQNFRVSGKGGFRALGHSAASFCKRRLSPGVHRRLGYPSSRSLLGTSLHRASYRRALLPMLLHPLLQREGPAGEGARPRPGVCDAREEARVARGGCGNRFRLPLSRPGYSVPPKQKTAATATTKIGEGVQPLVAVPSPHFSLFSPAFSTPAFGRCGLCLDLGLHGVEGGGTFLGLSRNSDRRHG